jgi:hypothetical protein
VCLEIAYAGTTGTLCYDTICKEVTIVITNISENLPGNYCKLYPNPVKDYFIVEGANEGEIKIYNLEGKLLQSTPKNHNKTIVDLVKLNKGVYYIKISTFEKMIKLVKI